MIKESFTIPKGAQIIFDRKELNWTCDCGCEVTPGFTELKDGRYWLTKFCTFDLECSIRRIKRDYPEMVDLIKQPFSFISKEVR